MVMCFKPDNIEKWEREVETGLKTGRGIVRTMIRLSGKKLSKAILAILTTPFLWAVCIIWAWFDLPKHTKYEGREK